MEGVDGECRRRKFKSESDTMGLRGGPPISRHALTINLNFLVQRGRHHHGSSHTSHDPRNFRAEQRLDGHPMGRSRFGHENRGSVSFFVLRTSLILFPSLRRRPPLLLLLLSLLLTSFALFFPLIGSIDTASSPTTMETAPKSPETPSTPLATIRSKRSLTRLWIHPISTSSRSTN